MNAWRRFGWILLLGLLAACRASTPLPAPAAAETVAPSPAPSPSSPAADNPKWALWTQGVQLRGANIYQRRVFPELDGETFLGPGPFGPPYTQADFDALAAAGANYVNLSVPGVYTVRPPYRLDEAALAHLDALVAMAVQADLFVVISIRSGPGRSEFSILREGAGDWFPDAYLVETVWQDPAARAAWAEMWGLLAAHYADQPAVIGYDLMVEPNPDDIVGVWEPEAFLAAYGGSGYDWNAWYPDLARAIRAVDPQTPILVGGMGYSSLDWLPYLEPVDLPYVVYTVHQYAPFVYTHQEPEPPRRPYPGRFDLDEDGQPEAFDAAWLQEALSPLEAYRRAHHAPVAVNECGLTRWAPGAAAFMADQLEALEALGVNYAVWMWYPDWPPLAEGDHDFNFRLGPDPANRTPTPNDLWAVYERYWARNQLRLGNWLP